MLYYIPSQLKSGDKIIVSGSMRPHEYNFEVELVTALNMHAPDHDNVFCHVSVVDRSAPFIGSSTYQGQRYEFKDPLEEEMSPTLAGALLEGPKFILVFKVNEGRSVVDVCNVSQDIQNGDIHRIDPEEHSSNLFQFKVLHDIGSVRFMNVSDNVQIHNIQFIFAETV